MTQQEVQKARAEVEKEIAIEIAKLPLPKMERAMDIGAWAALALMSKSPDAAGLHYRDYKNICTMPVLEWNFPMLGAALNTISASSPNELKCSGMSEYFDIMDYVAVIAAEWNEAVKPVKQSIIRKHETRLRISEGLPASKTIKLGGQA